MKLDVLDYQVIGLYLAFIIWIGFILRRTARSSAAFLLSPRSTTLWISSLAFISANMGAQELIGMNASGAKYGLMTGHLYWLGAIPAMLFLGVFMMPFFYKSGARSVPEFLAQRFDEKTRAFNALSFAVMTLFSSGISLYVLALLFAQFLGWNFHVSILTSAAIVLAYTFTGGLSSAIYNEVLQFFLIVLGILPATILGATELHGWPAVKAGLGPVMTHIWKYADQPAGNPMGVNIWQLVFGLGFSLSFGYWCTDYLVIQRALTAKNEAAARGTPIVASFVKMFLPIVSIGPGLIAATLAASGNLHLPAAAGGAPNYNLALPLLLSRYFPHGLFGVGVTALLASFMSGMAGNVTAFNTVVTYDLYESYIHRGAADRHYLRVGKVVTVVGVLLSVATAYLASRFNNIMDLLQLVFGFVNAPLFAVFLLGMSWRRATGHGAFAGLVAGTAAAFLVYGASVAEGKGGWLLPVWTFRSTMAQSFTIAWVSTFVAFAVTLLVSLVTRPPPAEKLRCLARAPADASTLDGGGAWYQRPLVLAAIAALLALIINITYF